MYLFHKKMKEDAEKIADPFWKMAYGELVERYKWLEQRVQERLKDMEEMHQQIERLERLLERSESRNEDDRIDYLARLSALGMSERDIREFEEYWTKRAQEESDAGAL